MGELDDDRLRSVYRTALVTRAVDERLWILSRQGRAGFVLTARGHEVAQVASALALRIGHDSAWLYYRDLGVGLALGITPYELFLGALGRADDPHSGGRQLTSHFSDRDRRIGSVSSEVGAHLPHAVGAAYAAKMQGEDAVAVCWFGDGASSEGAAHEAMNFAGVHCLPAVFVCENNGWAISVPTSLQLPIDSLADRAPGYGMQGASVDGCDAEAVFAASNAAIERARTGGGPSIVELRVPRIVPHSSQDDDAYRDEDQRREALAADPLPVLRNTLLERGALTVEQDADLVAAVTADVVDAQNRAWRMAEPTADRARRWLFAET